MPLKPFKPKKSFSKPQLIVYCLVFAAIGGYILLKSHAVGPAVWLSTTGNDSTCTRLDQTKPCQTFNRAFQVALSGDLVSVSGGNYAMTAPSEGATPIDPDNSKNSPVTFTCQGNGNVTFAAPVFAFHPGLGWVTMQGDCFHFHIPTFGYGGYSQQTHDITLDGVHMDSLEILGAKNITIENSEIGPIDDCYKPGSTGNGDNGYPIPSSAWCDPNNPVEAYWATQPVGSGGTRGLQSEPFIHQGAAGVAANILLQHDRFHGLQTKDANNMHQGGLLVWGTDQMTIQNTRFDHNAIYNIEYNGGSVQTNGLFQNNVLEPSDYWLDSTANAGQPLPDQQSQEGLTNAGGSFTNYLIRYNTFVQNWNVGTDSTSYSNVRIVGNMIGNYSNCIIVAGVTYDHNASGQGGRCGSGASVAGDPFANSALANYSLLSNSPAVDYIPCASGDLLLTTDFNNFARPQGTNCDAGAFEYGSSSTSPKPGDLNGDNTVNITDLSILLSNYNTSNAVADINKDGTVNILDLSILLSNYGT